MILLTPEAFHDKSKLHQFYHEVSHLWNVKSLDPLPPRFESEGLAVFLEYLLQKKLEGKSDALREAAAILRSVREAFAKTPVAARTAMIDFGRADITSLAYTKGMLFFDLLFRLMGEEDFLAALSSFDQNSWPPVPRPGNFLITWRRIRDSLWTSFSGVTGVESSSYILDGLPFDEILKKYQ